MTKDVFGVLIHASTCISLQELEEEGLLTMYGIFYFKEVTRNDLLQAGKVPISMERIYVKKYKRISIELVSGL